MGSPGTTSGSFDVITSISGPAQVKDDSTLIATMWTLLKPGGRLIISVPCTFDVTERISDHDRNEETGSQPFLSRPRIYDPQLLQERFFSVLGEVRYRGPVCVEVEDRAYEHSLEARQTALKQSAVYLRNFIADQR